MIRAFTEGVTASEVIANKPLVKKHLTIAVSIIALAIGQGFLFGYLKRIWLRRFANDMREELSKRK